MRQDFEVESLDIGEIQQMRDAINDFLRAVDKGHFSDGILFGGQESYFITALRDAVK